MTVTLIKQLQAFGSTIKISHSIFALPFVGAAILVVPWSVHFRGGSNASRLIWIIIAALAARTAAMGFNRISDAAIDARNPRTANREIPSGKLSIKVAVALTLCATLLFEFSAFMLGPPCPVLAPIVMVILFGYSVTKRFTWLCHFFLGLALACGPWGAAVAIGAALPLSAILLGTGVALWVAGFDILYACQDADFDAAGGSCSIPGRFGIQKAFTVARILHVGAAGFWGVFAFVIGGSWIFILTLTIVASLLVAQHKMLRPDDLSKVPIAFFNLNAWVSVVFFLGLFADRFASR